MKLIRWAMLFCGLIWADSGGSTGLLIEIKPEAYVNPSSLSVSFNVIHPGESVTSVPVSITGWVRALSGQRVRLIATSTLPLQWNGTISQSTGGGASISCTSGNLLSSTAQDLVDGWNRSGVATCSIRFTLATGTDWLPGTYIARMVVRAVAY